MLEIKRNGLIITPIGSLDASAGSYDVPVTLTNDDTYSDYVINMFVGWYARGVLKKRKAEIDSDGNYLIPKEAFQQKGMINISFLLEKIDKSQGLMTNALSYQVKNAPNVIIEVPADPTWEEIVREWCAELINATIPIISVSKKDGVTTLNITDINGTKTVLIEDGYIPVKGVDYTDGISPIVSVNQITEGSGGYNISITDANGTKTIDILNGSDGSDANVTDENIKKALGFTPAKQEDVNNLSREIANLGVGATQEQINQIETNKNNIATLQTNLNNEVTARKQAVASLNERLGQQHVFVAEGSTQEEAEAWVKTNGDKTKLYLMPDETFWQYKATTEVVEGGATYTNLLPTSKATDRATIYNEKGYKENTKLSGSSGGESTAGSGKEAMCSTGFIFPVKDGDILRIKNAFPVTGSNHYVVAYNSANTRIGNTTIYYTSSDGELYWSDVNTGSKYTLKDGIIEMPLTTEVFGSGFDTVRICAGMNENTIITLNEEIKEGGGTTTIMVEKWGSTGHGLLATEYDEIIATLNSIVDVHTQQINELKQGVGTSLTDKEKLDLIKKWDMPIYDANIPVFELTTEKNAVTEAEKSVASVYAKYDSLMAKYPSYITKTDLGVCSDGVTHVYRYDFRESEPHRGITGKKEWSETKTKAIIVSGIHWEWGGIFSLYNALEEIAENPKLFDFRRNTHLIVLPVCNPYAVANMSVRNANQVEIHRNFEVDFIYPGESGYIEIGERSHGGTTPLSEVETQYIDNIMKENTDSALFLTCHSNQQDEIWGTGFTWASPATYYMCNLHYRLVDKLSKSWIDRFGDVLMQGIEEYKTENLEDGDTRLGSAYLSTTNGTETKQATKYGIQATNIEVCDTFHVHGTKAKPEKALSSFTISRGAETYINFLLTAFGVYDYKDKEQYYK